MTDDESEKTAFDAWCASVTACDLERYQYAHQSGFRAGLEHARATFDWRASAAEYCEFFANLIKDEEGAEASKRALRDCAAMMRAGAGP